MKRFHDTFSCNSNKKKTVKLNKKNWGGFLFEIIGNFLKYTLRTYYEFKA